MNTLFSVNNFIPATFWIGHLAVALIGLVLLRNRARHIPSTRRIAYFASGGVLILIGLLPAAFASMMTVALVLGAMALFNVPIGVALGTALACALGLLSVYCVVYLIVCITIFLFTRDSQQSRAAPT